ncbi:unnamed protein product [Allacma fusca]|uniref:Uncharacterized protein n=1 Tax=Allacma fusca TaxID=39272 RepID=A0A8J2KUS0_9HEXA|nr:unnamed protein product [Allacma fusca]
MCATTPTLLKVDVSPERGLLSDTKLAFSVTDSNGKAEGKEREIIHYKNMDHEDADAATQRGSRISDSVSQILLFHSVHRVEDPYTLSIFWDGRGEEHQKDLLALYFQWKNTLVVDM